MFDLGWSELAVIAAVSVVVLGPKQLPETMRTMAKMLRRLRSLSAEFQGHMNEVIREAELDELRQKIQKLSSTNVTAEATKLIDPSGEIAAAMNPEPTPAPAPSEAALPAPEAAPASADETAAPEPGPNR